MSLPAFASVPADDASQAAQLLRMGKELAAEGRVGEAAAAYLRGVQAAAAAPAGSSIELLADLHEKLGNTLMMLGHLDDAAENYKSALRLAPHLTACWCNLGNVHLQTGNAQDAIALYLQALKLSPAHWPSRTNLAQALLATRQHALARVLLVEMAAERPRDGAVCRQLGKVCFELNDAEAALGHFHDALAINPRDAESLYWIGGIKQQLGDDAGAQVAYAEAARIEPLLRKPAVKSPADFRVLALYGPFAGNTPHEYLFKDAAHDTDTLALFESADTDIAALHAQLGDYEVVVNLISDADQSEGVLPKAAALARRLGKPVINDPEKIGNTTRDAIAVRLQGIPGCVVPRVLRLATGADHSTVAAGWTFPLLARPAGTHGGHDFEKIESAEQLASFLAQRPDGDHYLIDYVDYQSPDGYFRKYRFIFVDGAILPYHLAIGGDWKLHHDSTDMGDYLWMQQEEEVFLAEPSKFFTTTNYEALRQIEARIGLDYFGIDCGLDRDGNLVVFEVNASMLVHEDNKEFPYKNLFVRRITQAFAAMLQKRAELSPGT